MWSALPTKDKVCPQVISYAQATNHGDQDEMKEAIG